MEILFREWTRLFSIIQESNLHPLKPLGIIINSNEIWHWKIVNIDVINFLWHDNSICNMRYTIQLSSKNYSLHYHLLLNSYNIYLYWAELYKFKVAREFKNEYLKSWKQNVSLDVMYKFVSGKSRNTHLFCYSLSISLFQQR